MEFLSLQLGNLYIADVEACFGDLVQFVPDITSNVATKVRTFERTLTPGLHGKGMGFELPTYNQVVQKAMIFEEEYLNSKKIKEARPSTKGLWFIEWLLE